MLTGMSIVEGVQATSADVASQQTLSWLMAWAGRIPAVRIDWSCVVHKQGSLLPCTAAP